jgi:hypothetical protein
MKTTFKTLALIFCTVMMAAFSQVNATTVSNQVNEVYSSGYCGVTDAQIFNYMSDHGYQVLTIHSSTGTCNVLVTTTVGKRFILIINNGVIVDHEEVLS